MSDLEALAARVEAATGPDRELDDLIYVAATGACLHSPVVARVEVEPGEFDLVTSCKQCGSSQIAVPLHRYTASLDAAMTLVAEGYGFQVDGHGDDWWSSLSEDEGFNARAVTPALALTAAALRARAHIGGSNGQ